MTCVVANFKKSKKGLIYPLSFVTFFNCLNEEEEGLKLNMDLINPNPLVGVNVGFLQCFYRCKHMTMLALNNSTLLWRRRTRHS